MSVRFFFPVFLLPHLSGPDARLGAEAGAGEQALPQPLLRRVLARQLRPQLRVFPQQRVQLGLQRPQLQPQRSRLPRML